MVPDNTVGPLLESVGANPSALDAAAQQAIDKLPSSTGSSVSQPTLSGALARVLADAERVQPRWATISSPPSTS